MKEPTTKEPLSSCGPYRLLHRLGAGGLGEIFVAQGSGADAPLVALKRLLPEIAEDPVFVGMFQDEQLVASHLRHPNIVAVHEFGQAEETHYLVLEWIDGVSLCEVLQQAQARGLALPGDFAAAMGYSIAEALDYAHFRAIDDQGEPLRTVHRDVSPANIMLSWQGEVKLLDFGMAKARTQLRKTRPGLVKGKFGYLAPEQITGATDHRTDVFSLGLCLFEALAGAPLFQQTSIAAAVAAVHEYKQPPQVLRQRSDLSPQLVSAVEQCLACRPEKRYQRSGQLSQTLAEDEAHPIAPAVQMAAYLRELFNHQERPVSSPKLAALDSMLEELLAAVRRAWARLRQN
jgi:serine/threonine-protein kinase